MSYDPAITTTRIADRVKGAAKAIIAAVTPIVSVAVTDILAELSGAATAGIAAASTALLVYLVPNTGPTAP